MLSPGKAVIWAAFFNSSAFTFGTAVARTVGAGMIDIKIVTFAVVFGGLSGAIIWDLITWYYGLPTSSSHALIGGYAGAAVAKAGFAAIIPAGWTKTIIFIFLSPLIGLVAGLMLMTSIFWIFRWTPPSRVDRWFRRLQLVSAAFFSLNHGANDAQKTMGIIAGILFAAGYIDKFDIPFWVILAAHTAIGLGTLAGGWRIIHTMGSKITKLQPVGGFAAETSAAISILIATQTGVPVSTTHAITGAIVGVGATRRLSAGGGTGQIVWAWVLTFSHVLRRQVWTPSRRRASRRVYASPVAGMAFARWRRWAVAAVLIASAPSRSTRIRPASRCCSPAVLVENLRQLWPGLVATFSRPSSLPSCSPRRPADVDGSCASRCSR